MSNIFDRIQKRKAYPITIEGETIFVTEPTLGQISRIQKIDTAHSTGLALGLCLVDFNGNRIFLEDVRLKDDATPECETDEEFSRRVIEQASNCTASTIKIIVEAILKLAKPVKADPLIKN